MVNKVNFSDYRPAVAEDFPWEMPFILVDDFGKYLSFPNGLPMMKEMKLLGDMLYIEGDAQGTFDQFKHLVMTPSDDLRSAYEFYIENCTEDELKFRAYLDTPNWDSVTKSILKIVQKHQDYLCLPENLDQLAYIMMRWQNLYYAARVVYGHRRGDHPTSFGYGENNPKYEIEFITEIENVGECNEDLIYDAWCVGSAGLENLPDSEKWFDYNFRILTESLFDKMVMANVEDEFVKLQYKKNKTMDDWYALLGDKRYEYHSIYRTKHAIDNHLLFVNGNGYDWNADGYLCKDQPGGNDESDYGHFYCAKDKLRKDIKEELFSIIDDPLTQQLQEDAALKNLEDYKEHVKKKFASDYRVGKMLRKLREKGENTTMNDLDEFLDKGNPTDMSHDEMLSFLVKSAQEMDDWSSQREENSDESRLGDYYPICQYSAVHNMPDNVHQSYVIALEQCLQEIIDNADANRKKLEEKKGNQHAESMLGHFENNVKLAPELLEKVRKFKK